jgi:hypothetical protein
MKTGFIKWATTMVNMATKNTHIKLYNQPRQYSILDDSQGGF